MQQTAADDFRLHQIAQIKFQTNRKQQQQNADMSYMFQYRAGLSGQSQIDLDRGNSETGSQIANQ